MGNSSGDETDGSVIFFSLHDTLLGKKALHDPVLSESFLERKRMPMQDHLTVVISSSLADLPEHRREVMHACFELGMFPLMSEQFPVFGENVLDFRDSVSSMALSVDYQDASEFEWRVRDDLFLTLARLYEEGSE